MEENLTKKDKIHLLLIDKLGFALILIFVGFWVNSRLARIEKRHEVELKEKEQEFILYRDSIGRIYEERVNKLTIERKELDKISNNDREDLIRYENQHFKQRLKDYELFQSIQLEKIKTEISVEAQLNRSSIEYISKTWEKINEINLGSEVMTYNQLAYWDDNITADDTRQIAPSNSYGKDNNSLIQINTNLNLDSLRFQILDAEIYINKNRFWLGEDQRNLLINYLKINLKLIDQLKQDNSHDAVRQTVIELNKKRQDVFNYRDKLFELKL